MHVDFADIEEKDMAAVKAIYEYYIEHSTATFHMGAISIEEMREFLYIRHPVYASYLIYTDGAVCGYCFLSHYKKRQAYDRTAEVTVYLKPDYTGKGIGRLALEQLEKAARKAGIKVLMGIITGENQQSIRLFSGEGYEKCGHFRRVGEKFNRVLDVVAFQKIIE
jgi:L-amino acid N-acyltransferase YncA